MTARVLADDPDGREEAIRVLRGGGVVALPTDTVYGLAVDLATAGGIDRLFEVKRRPADRAIVLLLANVEQARDIARWPPTADRLAARFWPGGLTLVLPRRAEDDLPDPLTAGRPTIGVRLPDHDCPRTLARGLGPLPVTSANLSGLPAAVDAQQVHSQLGESIDLVLDGGPSRGGLASTVVDCTGDDVRVLRAGAVPEPEILAATRELG
jgi:L-threonylcarbamoyladenylate synthase